MKKIKEGKKQAASFKDNQGFVFQKEDKIFRQVNKSYKQNYDNLTGSGLYQKLADKKLLIPHQEIGLNFRLTPDAYKILKPQKIPFISYPYEWCFSQLKEAALATLEIQNIALEYNMSLRDASAFNIQFLEGKPILIDTLSFEVFEPKPWVAYRQFVEHFLCPLVLMSKIDPALNRLLSVYLDGIPVKLTSRMLPFFSKLSPAIFIHIQLHAMMEEKSGRQKNIKAKAGRSGKKSILGLIDSLKSVILSLNLPQKKSLWSGYNPAFDSYTPDAFLQKEKIVREFFNQTKAKIVWDLGSNIGHFSRLVGKKGAYVVSQDSDSLCVEKNYQMSKDLGNILPLVVDWTNPTPSLGWGGKERMSIFDRGPADLILALALIHHLAVGQNIPLLSLAKQFSKLCRFLIIEFVPKEDKQVTKMLSLREDIFINYHKEGFEDSFGKYFRIVKAQPIKDSLRIIYLMEKR